MLSENLKNKILALTTKYPEGKQKSALLPALHLIQEDGNNSLSIEQMDSLAGILSPIKSPAENTSMPVTLSLVEVSDPP